MAHFGWWGVKLFGREEWKSATTTSGALSVMTAGAPMMLKLHAGSLVSPPMVRHVYYVLLYHLTSLKH